MNTKPKTYTFFNSAPKLDEKPKTGLIERILVTAVFLVIVAGFVKGLVLVNLFAYLGGTWVIPLWISFAALFGASFLILEGPENIAKSSSVWRIIKLFTRCITAIFIVIFAAVALYNVFPTFFNSLLA